MNKEELSEAIREGINKSRDDFMNEITKGFLWAIGIVIVGFILIVYVIAPIWNSYENKKCIENPETCQIPIAPSPLIRCDKNWIHCVIKNYENNSLSKFEIISVGERDMGESFCGWEEAISFFNNFKENYKEIYLNLKLECVE